MPMSSLLSIQVEPECYETPRDPLVEDQEHTGNKIEIEHVFSQYLMREQDTLFLFRAKSIFHLGNLAILTHAEHKRKLMFMSS